jgi:formylglycine-generating enzyme required for sulfatase activity
MSLRTNEIDQMSQGSASLLKFYCPTHQIRFQAVGAEVIPCEQGGHTVGSGFPAGSWWEYCCDCETFWPLDPGNEVLRRNDCLVCERSIARRYLCSACLTVSHESALLVRRKVYSIDIDSGIKPNCPGCSQPSFKVLEHSCSEAASSLLTSRSVCPFCDGQIAAAGPVRTSIGPDQTVIPLNTFCPFCGKEQPLGNKFCKRCGKSQPKNVMAPKSLNEAAHSRLAVAGLAESKGKAKAREQSETRRHKEVARRAEQERLHIEERQLSPLKARDEGDVEQQAEQELSSPVAADLDHISIKEPAETAARSRGAVSDFKLKDWQTEDSRPPSFAEGPLNLAVPPAETSVSDSAAISQLAEPTKASDLSAALSDTDDSVDGSSYAERWGADSSIASPKKINRVAVAVGIAIVCLSSLIALAIFVLGRGQNEKHQLAPEVLRPVAPSGMAYIPGGEFLMGNNAGDDFEKPAHKVTVRSFYMDVHEVTCEDYLKFAATVASQPSLASSDTTASENVSLLAAMKGICPAGPTKMPATGIDWNVANAYARWAKKRLPTEEEWEFAARGTDGLNYPWGNEWKANAANVGSINQSVVDVGSYPNGKSSAGVMDLIGNAWEWTSSDLTAYPNGRIGRRPGGNIKVIRGGSWKEDKTEATSTYRGYLLIAGDKDYSATGIRCVQDITPQP